MFDTGVKTWREFEKWPPAEARTEQWYLRDGRVLSGDMPTPSDAEYSEYVSDPNDPRYDTTGMSIDANPGMVTWPSPGPRNSTRYVTIKAANQDGHDY